jgi:uncharacterized protein YdaU (DUF1376 family)
MSERPFMQLYVSDFIGDTLHLSTEQIGAYMLMLMAMWNAGGKLPSDEAKLARVARMSVKKWRAISDDLMAFFDASNGFISHNRLTKELQKSESKSQSRASAGAEGGRAKALKDKEARLANATYEPQHLPDTITRDTSSLRSEDAPAPKKQKASRLPQDWSLPRAWGQWAVSEGYPEQTIRLEAAKFKDFWIAKSGKDATKLDWFATWRNWIRNCSKSQPGHGPPPTARTMNDAIDDFIRNQDHELSPGTTIDHDGGDHSPNVHLLASPTRR